MIVNTRMMDRLENGGASTAVALKRQETCPVKRAMERGAYASERPAVYATRLHTAVFHKT